MHWCCLQGERLGAGRGSRRRNRRFVEEARLSRSLRPQACRGLVLGQRLIASPCSVCRFEQFGAAAFETRPALERGLRMPGERSDAGRWRPAFVRDPLPRCPLQERLWPHADAHRYVGSVATQPYIQKQRWATLGQRSPVAARRGAASQTKPHRQQPTNRDDDQGPAAAQVCPHHNMYDSLPRRTG